MSLPEVTLVCSLTRDVEVRFGKTGKPWGTGAVAAKEWSRDADKKWTAVDHFYDLIIFGPMAQNCATSLTRGMRLVVAGRLKHERWEKDGVKHSSYKIMVDDIAPALSHATAASEWNSDAPEWARR